MNDDEDVVIDREPRGRRVNRWLIVGIVAAVLAGILLASTVWQGSWKKSDEPPTNQIADTKPADMEKWCAAQATYDAMKHELFRRAAQVRGSDEQAYTRLGDFALLRVNGPVVRGLDDQLHSVTCSGTAVLSLPPGVQVAGGRRTLSGDIDYMIQPAADGTGNVIRLGNADAIVVPLATLMRTTQQQSAPAPLPEANQVADEQAPQPAQPQPQEQAPAPQPAPTTARPSFNCDNARTRGEVAVCNDPGLASLDRQMASQFNRALTQADRDQRRLLERTRNRFLSFRDHCGTNQCIADAYRGRMREISDIMADRWRG